MQGKKVYFLSDAHLGAKLLKNNREREIMLVEFLQGIKPDCTLPAWRYVRFLVRVQICRT